MTVDSFDLIMAADIKIDGCCIVKQPTLSEIRDIGFDRYKTFLNFILLDTESLLESLDVSNQYSTMTDEEKLVFTPFIFLLMVEQTREALYDAISFFVRGDIVFQPESLCFQTDIGSINIDNFEDFKSVVLQINYLPTTTVRPKKFKNKKAQEIYDKLQAERKKANSLKKSDKNISLHNLISSLSAKHHSYNLLNIGGLTIYQLYNQFYKLGVNIQMETIGLRWAAWGKDEFDFSLWYKEI